MVLIFAFAALSAHGLTAQAKPAFDSSEYPIAEQSSAARPPQCPATEHFDPAMQMCVPDPGSKELPRRGGGAKPDSAPTMKPPPPTSIVAEPRSNTAMNMPMPQATQSNKGVMIRLNQFVLYSDTFGGRGQSRLTGPGMWMLTYDRDLSSRNHLSVDAMGTPEHLTVGNKGTPQLLQTENIDAMHPHDYIMALELRDTLMLGTENEERLTFLFAPRGEAAIGPVPFMHRESAEGNPDAPLGHALQDGFHDVSTVIGVEYQIARTAIEATAFSGHDVVWPFPLHSPDSYSIRVNQKIDDHLSAGASYADALLPEDTGGAEHNHFIAAWLSASYRIGHGTLKSSLVWGRGRTARDAPLNSFLEEGVYQHGRSKFYDRAEILQIAPDQLNLNLPNHGAVPRWTAALTLGYERTVLEKTGLSLFAGASYTRDFIPGEFKSAYGPDPGGGKIYLRIAFDGGIDR